MADQNKLEIIGCDCNFGIPGVESLPTHDHSEAQMIEYMKDRNPHLEDPVFSAFPLQDSVHIWVDWKRVAKEVTKL